MGAVVELRLSEHNHCDAEVHPVPGGLSSLTGLGKHCPGEIFAGVPKRNRPRRRLALHLPILDSAAADQGSFCGAYLSQHFARLLAVSGRLQVSGRGRGGWMAVVRISGGGGTGTSTQTMQEYMRGVWHCCPKQVPEVSRRLRSQMDLHTLPL